MMHEKTGLLLKVKTIYSGIGAHVHFWTTYMQQDNTVGWLNAILSSSGTGPKLGTFYRAYGG